MRGGFATLAVLALIAGCVNAPTADLAAAPTAIAGVDAEGFAPELFGAFEFTELDLAVADGLRLHADVYLPAEPLAEAPAKFPTVLLLSPYWGGGTGGIGVPSYMPYHFLVERLLPRGYAVVFGDLAGNGGSSGCWDFMGRVERQSAVAMVEAIAAQDWSDGKVGMMGISYDGMTQIMAASDQAPHLTTVVPAAPLTHAYGGLIQNGVHYAATWHAVPLLYESSSLQGPGPNPERLPGWVETVRDSPQCIAENHAGDQPTSAYTAYYEARDYRALGADVKASVFYIQGFRDANVKPDNFGAWFDAVPTQKKAWLGHWFHQYPTAENGGRDDMYLALHRWFDHELKGIENGIDKEPRYDVQDSLGQWRHEDAWPPAEATPLMLQLGADGTLSPTGDAGSVSFGGPAALVGYVMEAGSGIAFESEPFADGLHIVGVPWLNLTLASDRPTGAVVARLWDGERLVAQGAYNLLYAGGLASPQPLTPGAPVALSFGMYPTDWALEPGGTLRLTLTTQDESGWYDPDAAAGTLTLDAGESAVLTLSTIALAPEDILLTSCGERLADDGPDCWLDLKDKGVDTT